MPPDLELREVRPVRTDFETREDGDGLHIFGYFAVFDSIYEIAPGETESVAPGAFSRALKENDIRALVNHDTTLVLGRNRAATLSLREDDHGLWGDILINPKDQDAVNLYERVKRGDVDQCSFGFPWRADGEITDVRADGSVHWTLTDVDLQEVSACTFPAYRETNIQARSQQREQIRQRALAAWKERTLKQLKGE